MAIKATIPATCLPAVGLVTSLICLITLRKPSYPFSLAFVQSKASWAGWRAGSGAQHCHVTLCTPSSSTLCVLHTTYRQCLRKVGKRKICNNCGSWITWEKNPKPCRRNPLQLTKLKNRKHQWKGCGLNFDPASVSFQIFSWASRRCFPPIGIYRLTSVARSIIYHKR